jgi:aromatic-L-amino-acid decarboxylase
MLDEANRFNESWMNSVNSTGLAFFSHTKLDEKYVIRWVIGQTDVTEKHIQNAWSLLLEKLEETKKEFS